MPDEKPKVLCVSPVFPVADVARSLEWYREKLGFEVGFTWQDPPIYAGVRRDEVTIHLCGTDSGPKHAATAYLFIDDVDGYAREIEALGGELKTPPSDYEYGMREIEVEDPDGNRLCFAQSSGPHEDEEET